MSARFRFDSRLINGKEEFVLWCGLTEGRLNDWVIYVWKRRPKKEDVEQQILFALRCFDLYYHSIQKPDYLAKNHSIEGLELTWN
jgi:hypothetical protein